VQQVVVDAEVPRVYNTHVKSSQIIAILKKDGWFIHNVRGSHHQFKHPSKPGKITVPHPKADLPIGTARAIFKQAGLEWKP
jgi:predicted RNA binding protein YcfA (HicA-like mRNA interferase family)